MLASFLGFLILALSASELEWSLFSGLQFVGAKNSESCLIEMRCLGEVSAACSVSKLELQLSFLSLRLNANSINFMS
ncbi:hypothetical protein C1S99_26130 [Vibrio parahaemolyticus]|nr:hypothetical protein [Vibrio parahaemolyticus]PMS39177.1 hypothetical protein C1T12_25800 [Vibrio parahaemolyticus]PMS57775.1 hypothetical protein C1S91_25745 [Vibrio parahaemolyticus]PMS65189.1 hypothetical protein C1S96_26225 [Vibrio parahaemolyticus]PMS70443.1 hypothetical protein C1T10_25945 [Vibrio parahaemolyticus]PMS73734.1 hypothetical protein C1S88_25535 [Vibrio parahaemolyticus]